MRVGIYNEPVAGIGGSECVSAVLARAIASRHATEIVHHHRDLRRETLEHYFDLDLSDVSLRSVDRRPVDEGGRRSLLPGQARRRWRAELSEPYDLFVAVCHSLPPFCHAQHGVLLVLFPLYRREADWPWNDPPRHRADVRRLARQAYYEHEWKQRLASYRTVVSISQFTRRWTNKYWDVDSLVVYPPVAMTATPSQKENLIVSVGRFTEAGHNKRHPELMAAFAALTDLRALGWRYECLGALANTPDDQEYFRRVSAIADSSGAAARANASRAQLNAALGGAKIFLHAAGLGVSDDRPDLMEHFGIATVEAMAAGCVPVVINKGGQPEIVEHGTSGFLWNTLEEMQHYMRMLAADDALRRNMSANAVARSERFSQHRFVEEMLHVLPLHESVDQRRPFNNVAAAR